MATKTFVSDYDPTAANNTAAAGVTIAQATSTADDLDDIFQAIMAAIAMNRKDLGGVNTVAGTATAVTVTAAQAWTAYGSSDGQIGNGQLLALKMGSSQGPATGAATLNVNTIGTKKIRREGDTAIAANDWLSGSIVLLRYDTAYDSASGAWVLLNREPSATASTSGQTLRTFFPRDNEPPSSSYATFSTRNGHPILVFPDAVTYAAIFTGSIPAAYGGGGLTVEIEWMCSTTSTNKVCFGAYIEYMDVGTTDFDSDSFSSEGIDTTGVAASATSGVSAKTTITFASGSAMDSLIAGATFRLKIVRETGQGNDTNAGDAQLLAVRVKET